MPWNFVSWPPTFTTSSLPSVPSICDAVIVFRNAIDFSTRALRSASVFSSSVERRAGDAGQPRRDAVRRVARDADLRA